MARYTIQIQSEQYTGNTLDVKIFDGEVGSTERVDLAPCSVRREEIISNLAEGEAEPTIVQACTILYQNYSFDYDGDAETDFANTVQTWNTSNGAIGSTTSDCISDKGATNITVGPLVSFVEDLA